MNSMNFIVYFSHFGKLIIYLSINFNVKIRCSKFCRKFPYGGTLWSMSKKYFLYTKGTYKKNKYIFTSEKPK